LNGTPGGATTGITPGRRKAEAELAKLYRERMTPSSEDALYGRFWGKPENIRSF
jgi:hypothetical protein